MKTVMKMSTLGFALYLAWITSSFAAVEALPLKHSIDLADFEGKPFLQVMLENKTGIKAQLDHDFTSSYTFSSRRAL